MKGLLLDYDVSELETIVCGLGFQKFRASQLYKWINRGFSFSEMTDIPQSLKDALSQGYSDIPLKIVETVKSSDGSEKYLYELNDGNIIEGVFMPHNYGNTLCVSTQVGCRMGCAFCASGLDGLVRHLSAGEILGQVIVASKLKQKTPVHRVMSNIVLMGSGEPLDNYDNTIKFIRLICNEKGLDFSTRSISLSTCGLVDKIKMLADENLNVTLSISLHATTDESRMEVMPVAKKYSINQIVDAAKYYFDKTHRRIIYEYALIKDNNMNFFDAKRLVEITKGYPSHVNLIMLNPVKERGLSTCTKQDADRFLERLTKYGVSATLRRSLATDIDGACGQLRAKYVGCENPVSSVKKD